jgi:hypothetical protein
MKRTIQVFDFYQRDPHNTLTLKKVNALGGSLEDFIPSKAPIEEPPLQDPIPKNPPDEIPVLKEGTPVEIFLKSFSFEEVADI